MSSADQDVSTGGGTGTGVQTIVKEKIKEMVEVRTRVYTTATNSSSSSAMHKKWRMIVDCCSCLVFCYVFVILYDTLLLLLRSGLSSSSSDIAVQQY